MKKTKKGENILFDKLGIKKEEAEEVKLKKEEPPPKQRKERADKGQKRGSYLKGNFRRAKEIGKRGGAKKAGTVAKKTEEFIHEMFDLYNDLGGKDFLLNHLRENPSMADRFIDRLAKLAAKEMDREMTLKLNVSGSIQHEHLVRYGFTPELIGNAISELREAGDLDAEEILKLNPPPEEEGSYTVDGEFREKVSSQT